MLRSYLYVPGDREELFDKALASRADAIVLDLEDAVPAERKAPAREAVVRMLSRAVTKPVWVRVNEAGSEEFGRDAAVLADASPAGIRLPKCESAADVHAVTGRLPGLPIQCLIETALGVERAYALACSHHDVVSVGLGEADLRSELGVADDAGLLYARSRIVVASRAAGLEPPVQSVYVSPRDESRLARTCRQGRELGFFGRSAIHPAQVATINAAYTPTREEIADARTIVEQLTVEEQNGSGALILADGRFVDRAVAISARRTIALAERLGKETFA